jgi:signal peptidase II
MALIPPRAAVRSPRTRWAAAGIAAVVVAVDQVTKSLVLEGRLSGGAGWVDVRLVRNTGSAGGLAHGHPVPVFLLAVTVTAVATALLLRARRTAMALLLSLVVAGAAGNLTDRLARAPGLGRGAVVDWIHWSFRSASMNISDIAIDAGALGLVIVLAATRERVARTARDQSGLQEGTVGEEPS